MDFEPVIGFEVHVQLATESKIFCACANEVGGEPNTRVCPVCLGLPGSLPVLNREALRMGMTVALALDAEIATRTSFDRKNYFYPDLPKGYQITQSLVPLATGGRFPVTRDGSTRTVRIRQIHLEEDAGKTLHGGDGTASLVDMNRCGVPLVEIVTRPDLRSPEEAEAFLVSLRRLLVYLGVATGKMHEGSMRFDTNVSLRRKGEEALGTQTEIKNLNSFRAVREALRYEIERQTRVLEADETVVHETLLWDPGRERAVAMRSKEIAPDYRYFPEPDLPEFAIDAALIEERRAAMPETPSEVERRFRERYGLSAYDVGVLSAEPGRARYYEAVVAELARRAGGAPSGTGDLAPVAKLAANWVTVVVGGHLHSEGIDLVEFASRAMSPARLAEVLLPRLRNEISEPAARRLFAEAVRSADSVDGIIETLSLGRLGDASELVRVVDGVLADCPDEVERYQAGERRLLRHFVGQVMKKTGGRADPALATRLITERLDSAG